MELCEKKLINMHLFSAKTRLSPCGIFSEFHKATQKFVFSTKFTAYKY